jgi:Ca-activated chloride channel homolog
VIEFGPFAILRPWWLLALPAIALAAFLLSRRAIGLAAWEQAVDPLLMSALRQMGQVIPGGPQRQWPIAALAGAIALALSGPATKTAELSAFRNLDGLVLAVDLSRSVTGSGNLPTALSAARLAAEAAGSLPVALVVYGEDAYEASGFTIDKRALGTTIAVLDAETVPGAGSNPKRALALSRKLLEESRTLAGDIMLVSDGGGIGDNAIEEAKSIAAKGARVSALFVPHTDNSTAPPADRMALQRLTGAARGQLADIGDSSGIMALAEPRTSSRLAEANYAVLAWRDHGRVLLILALAAALTLFRKKA